MRSSQFWILLLGGVFMFGIWRLFDLRFATGDVYPRYSSLRADPEGTRALYDSLSEMPGYQVSRNYRPLARLAPGDQTVLYLGSSPEDLDQIKALEDLAKAGARVVIAFRANPAGAKIKESERQVGRGSIVIAPSAYPFTNLALERDRDTALLLRLIGPNKRTVFDEEHLGVSENGSIATLARKYNLQAFVAALLLLAALFVWKNSVSLLPPKELPPAGYAAAKDTASGLANLLRRNIPKSQLVKICFEEWEKTRPRVSPERLARVKPIALSDTDPLKAYQEISRVLADRTL